MNDKLTKQDRQAWDEAIKLCPDEILTAEFARRAVEAQTREIPKMQYGHIDRLLKPLANLAQSYVDQLAEEPAYDDYKIKDYIFEAAIELFFGKDVWEWVKKRLQ